MTDNNVFNELKEAVQRQIQEAYMEGAHQGATTTCAIVYQTMRTAGLEEDNFLFDILRDIAKTHGCEDLAAMAAKMKNKTDSSDTSILS